MNLGAVLMTIAGVVVGSGEPDLAVGSAPPVVIKTVPESGATGIDSTTAELRVTFSKTMRSGAWSWNKGPEGTFPKLTGQPRYEKDGRTCVLPVSLIPGKTYAVWINSPSGANFQDEGGRRAIPYLLIFATRKTTAATNIENASPGERSPSKKALQRTIGLPRFARAAARR
jgi:RNA polymerase sigma-70 factor (ECF subfamily)